MKNIILIQSHCDTEEKKQFLKKNIEKLKTFNIDILLFSHLPLEKDIIEKVDYFVYDKSNPTLWEERRHYFWWIVDGYKLETTIQDYGWTVFNQIIKSFSIIQKENYNYIFNMCYDLEIDNTVVKFLENPINSVFKHAKSQKDENNFLEFKTGLIFFVLQFDFFNNFVNSINKKDYSENWGQIAEEYFEIKIKNLGISTESSHIVYDKFHQTNNIFDLYPNQDFEIFIDNVDFLKFRLVNKNEKEIIVIIDDEFIKMDENVLIYNQNRKKLFRFGLLIENNFVNLIELFFEKKINKMSFLN